MCRDSVALDLGPGNSNSAVNCMLGWLKLIGFAFVIPVRTGLCTSISYAVNQDAEADDGPGPEFRGPSEGQSMTTDVGQLYGLPVGSPPPLAEADGGNAEHEPALPMAHPAVQGLQDAK